jgi:hypothetical protein
VGELGWAQPVFDFSHVGGLQQKPLGPSAQLSPALETGEKNNSKIWITTYQSQDSHDKLLIHHLFI